MERDPVRFVWRTTFGLHLLLLVLILAMLPLTFMAVDLVRVILDDAVGGRAFVRDGMATLLRIAVPVPREVAPQPMVLFEGVVLNRESFGYAAALVLLLLGAMIAAISVAIGLVRSEAGTRATRALRDVILDAILASRPAARDEAREAAILAGESLTRASGFLGAAVLTPLLAGGLVAGALLYALAADWRLGVAVLFGTVLSALVWPRRAAAVLAVDAGRAGEGAAHRRTLLDLVRRLPASRAHGASALERQQVKAECERRHAGVRALERRLSVADAARIMAGVAVLAAVLGTGAVLANASGATSGRIAAVTVAALIAVGAVEALTRWRGALTRTAALLEEIARQIGAMQSRARSASVALPGSGALVARGLAAYDPASGTRIGNVDLALAFPAHVALTGEADSGSRVLAALIGGGLEPSVGTLTFAGVDLASIDPAGRAQRIAFAGGDTILLAGTLRQNLLYGAPGADAPDMEQRLIEAVTVAGLDRLVHARGLSGTVDPVRDPKLAAAIVDARRKVRAALAAGNLEGFVDPFDRERYNAHATIAENILFGMPLGDTFRDGHLPSHPFVRALLEAEDLTKPLADMGASIARSMIEIFADLPDDHPLFDRFGFFPASERSFYEDLVARQDQPRRGAERTRDRERLIGLALSYNENRHRLGLMDEILMGRLLRARAAFAQLLPTSLQPAIEFYDADRVCAAASVQDNLLFGRIAQDRAGAETEVLAVIRSVLAERGLDRDLFRVGLDMRIDPRGDGLVSTEIAAIDLARCLVRRPDVLVVERSLDGLPASAAAALAGRLRRAQVGRGLVLVTPKLDPAMDSPPFDAVIRFERGTIAHVDDRRRAAAA